MSSDVRCCVPHSQKISNVTVQGFFWEVRLLCFYLEEDIFHESATLFFAQLIHNDANVLGNSNCAVVLAGIETLPASEA